MFWQYVRVHGEKVAEVPFVGTRLHYRRHGFCRILMSGLEQVFLLSVYLYLNPFI